MRCWRKTLRLRHRRGRLHKTILRYGSPIWVASEMKSAPPGKPSGADSLFRTRLPLKQAELRFQFPGIARAKEFCQVTFAAFRLHFANLVVDQVFIARHVVPRAEARD